MSFGMKTQLFMDKTSKNKIRAKTGKTTINFHRNQGFSLLTDYFTFCAVVLEICNIYLK